jgi:hypothetical protein
MPLVCQEHGSAQEAYVCEHLLQSPAQVWCSAAPNADNPCPDAWCLACDEAFQRFGEWNEQNEHEVPIKLICQGCYIKKRVENTDR